MTDWVRDRLYTLLNRRWNECRPLIVTTNCAAALLAQRTGEGATSRLAGICARRIEVTGPDLRRRKAASAQPCGSPPDELHSDLPGAPRRRLRAAPAGGPAHRHSSPTAAGPTASRDGAERLIAAAEERLAARACVSRRRELARVRRRLEALLATCTARKDEGAAAAAERLLQSLASE